MAMAPRPAGQRRDTAPRPTPGLIPQADCRPGASFPAISTDASKTRLSRAGTAADQLSQQLAVGATHAAAPAERRAHSGEQGRGADGTHRPAARTEPRHSLAGHLDRRPPTRHRYLSMIILKMIMVTCKPDVHPERGLPQRSGGGLGYLSGTAANGRRVDSGTSAGLPRARRVDSGT